MSEDPYVYPGTFTLINLRDIRDSDRLHDFEANSTFRRGLELLDRPVAGKFDRVHLQRIHKHLFQDVYAWAGKIRTVDIRKEDSMYFARPEFITMSLDELFSKLDRKGGLVGVDAATFADHAGDFLGDLNAIHPFREGNGRAQQEFLRELAARSGHELSWARVSREDMYRESAVSFKTGSSSGLAKLLSIAIVVPDGDEAAEARLIEQQQRGTFTSSPEALEAIERHRALEAAKQEQQKKKQERGISRGGMSR